MYQIRNAFAHDISERKCNITQQRYARVYEFGNARVDPTNVGSKHFEYGDIGGPDVLFICGAMAPGQSGPNKALLSPLSRLGWLTHRSSRLQSLALCLMSDVEI